jgi:Ser/Thr protein kinase RdoA (MazF antagonist)
MMLRRRNPRYARPDWVRFDHALLAHLAGDSLPVPRGFSGDLGQAWLRQGDRIYELFEFIEGRQHREGDAAEIRAAGEVLAQLHLSAADFDAPVEKPWPRFHDPKDLADWLEPLTSEATGEDAAVLANSMSLAADIAERLSDRVYFGLPQTVVQGDYHPANLKFRDSEVVGVFDWDWASRQPRMVDVADGLLFFCGERRRPLKGGDIWSLTEAFEIRQDRVRCFLDGYTGHITPRGEELVALPDLMRSRWLYCRADAAHRKVEPECRVEFVTRDLATPLRGIDAIEAKLRGLKTLKE